MAPVLTDIELSIDDRTVHEGQDFGLQQYGGTLVSFATSLVSAVYPRTTVFAHRALCDAQVHNVRANNAQDEEEKSDLTALTAVNFDLGGLTAGSFDLSPMSGGCAEGRSYGGVGGRRGGNEEDEEDDDVDDELTSLAWLQDANLLKNITNVCSDSPLKEKENKKAAGLYTLVEPHYRQPALPYDPITNKSDKPPYSFSCLIFMAIEESRKKRLPVKDIYDWIVKNFPFFRSAPAGWRNSVRHNLSLNKCFRKMSNDFSEFRSDGTAGGGGGEGGGDGIGKGSSWCVDPLYRPNLLHALKRTPYHPYLQLQMTHSSGSSGGSSGGGSVRGQLSPASLSSPLSSDPTSCRPASQHRASSDSDCHSDEEEKEEEEDDDNDEDKTPMTDRSTCKVRPKTLLFANGAKKGSICKHRSTAASADDLAVARTLATLSKLIDSPRRHRPTATDKDTVGRRRHLVNRDASGCRRRDRLTSTGHMLRSTRVESLRHEVSDVDCCTPTPTDDHSYTIPLDVFEEAKITRNQSQDSLTTTDTEVSQNDDDVEFNPGSSRPLSCKQHPSALSMNSQPMKSLRGKWAVRPMAHQGLLSICSDKSRPSLGGTMKQRRKTSNRYSRVVTHNIGVEVEAIEDERIKCEFNLNDVCEVLEVSSTEPFSHRREEVRRNDEVDDDDEERTLKAGVDALLNLASNAAARRGRLTCASPAASLWEHLVEDVSGKKRRGRPLKSHDISGSVSKVSSKIGRAKSLAVIRGAIKRGSAKSVENLGKNSDVPRKNVKSENVDIHSDKSVMNRFSDRNGNIASRADRRRYRRRLSVRASDVLNHVDSRESRKERARKVRS